MFDYADQELALKLTIEEEKRLSLNQGKKIGRRDGMKIGEKKGEKKGEKIGRRDGMKIGRRDGMKIGKRDEKQETVKRMLAQKKVSLEDIASYTALPLAEIQRIAALSGSDPRDQI